MLSKQQWPRARELFDALLGLSPAQRAEFWSQRDAADLELQAEVDRLLAADSRSDQFLEPPWSVTAVPSLVGRSVGGFRITRLVGRGGMGSVWEAWQDQPQRRVAVKTMHVGIDSEQLRHRFHYEAQSLASLRHAGIAQVYGAGELAFDDGQPSLPWFALEFVEDAVPLVQYAQDRGLDLTARLRLLASVCNAVQHAHQRGLIHRDLKSANLLVDRDGHVKVIDFGIARSTDPGQQRTLSGEIVGTLESMSPEQVDGRSDEVDVRTDVYALGTVLYQLVAQQKPYRLEGLSLPAAAQLIRESEPRAPSKVIAQVPRELDWIIATAMAKDPSRRYSSARDLELELQRFLDREPLQAGPPSGLYRLRKFCQRHRTGVVAAVFALVAVTSAAATLVYGHLKDEQVRAAKATADAESRLVSSFSKFFFQLFGSLMPEIATSRDFNRVQVLKNGTAWIRDEITERPLLRSQLLRSVGQVHTAYGEHREALDALLEAVVLARREGETGAFDLAEALQRLGRTYRQLDDLSAAEAALHEALTIEQRLFGANSMKLGPILNELGVLLGGSDPERALEFYRRAYDLEVGRFGAESRGALFVLGNLGCMQLRAGKYSAARDTLEHVLPLLAKAYGERDSRIAVFYGRLGSVHRRLANYDRALELIQLDLEITKATMGSSHPDVGMALLELSALREASGADVPALETLDQAVAIFRKQLEPSDARLIRAQTVRASVMLRLGRHAEAREALRAVQELTPSTGPGRIERLASALVLAQAEAIGGQNAEAIRILEAVLGDPSATKHRKLVWDAHWQWAYVCLRQGQLEAARAARQQALAIDLQGLDAGVAPQLQADAKYSALSGDHDRAIQLLLQAIEQGDACAMLMTDPAFRALRATQAFHSVQSLLNRSHGR